MSILETAKRLAELDKLKHQKELAAIAQIREYQEALIETVKAKVAEVMAPLHGQHDFIVNSEKEAHNPTVVCKLYHKAIPVGYVCVEGENYKFRGSDESPEQDAWCVSIVLAAAPRMKSSFVRASVQSTHEFDKGINNFEQAMAVFLKKFF